MWILNSYLAFANVNCEAKYELLKDQEWVKCTTDNFYYSNFFVNYVYYQIDDNIDFDFIKKEILSNTKFIFEYAESLNFKNNECIQNNYLEIYQIDSSDLNNLDFGYSKSSNIWGLYLPMSGSYSSIILSNQGRAWNKIIFAHELSHYWFDRMCWNLQWNDTPESFSKKFETYYATKY